MRSFVSHGFLLAAGAALGFSFALAGHATDRGTAGPQPIGKLAGSSKAEKGEQKKSISAAPKKSKASDILMKIEDIKGESK